MSYNFLSQLVSFENLMSVNSNSQMSKKNVNWGIHVYVIFYFLSAGVFDYIFSFPLILYLHPFDLILIAYARLNILLDLLRLLLLTTVYTVCNILYV